MKDYDRFSRRRRPVGGVLSLTKQHRTDDDDAFGGGLSRPRVYALPDAYMGKSLSVLREAYNVMKSGGRRVPQRQRILIHVSSKSSKAAAAQKLLSLSSSSRSREHLR